MNTTPSNTRVATMLVVGVLLLPIVVGVGVVWYVLAQPQAEASVITMRVETPERVVEGDTVEMAVTLHNATDRPVTLVGIDLSGGYLDGFVLIRTEPAYVAEAEGPVFRGFDYNLALPARGDVRVVFRMQAVAAGEYAGDVDARLTGSTGLLTTRVQTAVAAPGSESGPGTTDPDDDPIIIQPSENQPMPAATALTRRFVPTDFDPADWAQSQPLIDDLTQRTLTTVGEAQQWLADYGELTAVLREHGALTNIAKACDTESEQVDRAFLHWVEDIDPKLAAARDRLGRKLLDSGLADELPADEFATMVRDWRAGVELFRAENVPLQTKLTKLASDYDKHLGGLTVEFRGEERALPQLAKFQEDSDRATREEAWRMDAEQRLTVREKIDGIYSEQVALRDTMAKNAGLPDYTEWQWRDSRRFDYTRDDCTRFCDAIAEVCVPRVRALNEKRKAALGVETLRPWDASADPHGRAPLTPFASDNAQGLVDGCHAIFEAIDPSLATDFSRLKMGRNLDLVARKGKRGGGFQSSLTERREPFIFMNAAGRQIDVRVMLHEAGHAFHYMWGSAAQPSYFNQGSPIEFAEVASMTMELFGLDHYGEFYPGDEAAARRAKHELLEGIVRFFPWMAAIDRFQHWVYANPAHTPDERTAAWLDLVNTYGTRHGGAGVDWAGLDDELASYWQRQIHLPHYPFYYVEYGIAQLGALQLWQQYRSDPGKALANYRNALSLGKRRTLPGLFEAAGIRFDFSRDTLEPLIRDVAEAMDALVDGA